MSNEQQQEALIGPLDPQAALVQLTGGAMSLAVASVGAASFDEHREKAYGNACRLAEKALDVALQAAANTGPASQLEAVLGDFAGVMQLMSQRLNDQGGATDGN